MYHKKRQVSFLIPVIFLLASCTSGDLYEKNVTIPGFSWKSGFRPEFSFTIRDTTSLHQLFIVFRHNEKYNFNNIWFNLYAQTDSDSMRKFPIEIELATNKEGWRTKGINDVYEHRRRLDAPGKFKAGKYHFFIEHIMREDPLQNVLSVGLRLEKLP